MFLIEISEKVFVSSDVVLCHVKFDFFFPVNLYRI